MIRVAGWRWLLAGCLVGGWMSAAATTCGAAEETERFLEGLRSLGYYDVALDYLEQMRESPLADEQFKEKIDFEAGSVLIDSARSGGLVAVREKQLADAEGRFNKFLAEHAGHPLVTSAKMQLANLLVERGKLKNEQAADRQDPEKQQLQADARKLFDDAQKVFEDLEKRLLEAHQKFPKFIDPKETEQIAARDRVRTDLLQARLGLASVLYEIAQTYPEGNEQRKKNLVSAAEKYNEFYEKYSTRLAGLYARMFEGRCYKDLGEADKAFEAFEDLMTQPDDAEQFRLLKLKAAVLAVQTALMPSVKKYKQAVDMYQAWDWFGREEISPVGLALKCEAGEAALEYARTLKANHPDRAKMLALAGRLFRDVVKVPNEYQSKARLLAMAPELGGGEKPPDPTTFEEARDLGDFARSNMAGAEMQLELAREKNDQDKINQYEGEIAEARDEALYYYQAAMGLKTADTPLDQLNVVRYYLGYLYWSAGDAYRAAVLGEFLARRYPSSAGGAQGAKIAMVAWLQLYGEARDKALQAAGEQSSDVSPAELADLSPQWQFESDRLIDIARYTAQRWANQPDAGDAWIVLIRTAILDGHADQALEYLKQIPEDSPRRADAELLTGQSMWSAYLKAASLPQGQRPGQAELDAMVEQAETTLEAGLQRMRKAVEGGAEKTYTLAAAALSLAQINLEAGQPQKAVEWLDDPQVGVMTLVKAGHPVTERSSFRIETYKAALRAYVATQQLEKAEEAMRELEDLTKEGGDENASRKLTAIYISLGRELQEQLERLREGGKTEQINKVSNAFQLFLTEIAKRGDANFSSLHWVAETFASLAAGFDTGTDTLSDEAKEYFTQAADTYTTILERIAKDPSYAPEGADLAIKVRLARCKRRLGEYPDAFGLLLSVLQQKEAVLDAQKEAAFTYQAWGTQNPDYYVLAIRGSQKYKQMWGWGAIARRVMGKMDEQPALSDAFFEARYNLALCRFKLAMSKKTQADQAPLLRQAQGDILQVFKLFPKLGGPQWYAKYDDLYKTIQKLLGERPDGLRGAERAVPVQTAGK